MKQFHFFEIVLTLFLFINIDHIRSQFQQPSIPSDIKIGAIFDADQGIDPAEAIVTAKEIAFTRAITKVNNDRSVLSRSRLRGMVVRVQADNSFKASIQVCKLVKSGLAAFFGPDSKNSANHIKAVTNALSLPYIESRWDYTSERPPFSLNVYPHPASLGKAYADYVKKLGWKSLVIVYDSEESLVRLQELIKLPLRFDGLRITLRRIKNNAYDIRPLFKTIKKSLETQIVLDCKFEKIEDFLKQANEVGILNDYYNYLITSLDLERVNLEPYKYNNVNITGFRIINGQSSELAEYVKKWKFGNPSQGTNHPLYSLNALTYDSVRLFASAMDELGTIESLRINPLSCERGSRWTGGQNLLNYIKETEYSGLTGDIRFDINGFRTYFKLDVLEKHRDLMVKTGTWLPDVGVNYTRTAAQVDGLVVEKLQNKTLRVTTALTEPYLKPKKLVGVTKEALERMSFEEKYEGYVIDLVKYLSKEVKFKYVFHMVRDGAYGKYNEIKGEWNGMIGELINQKADMAVIDLSITSQRQKAIDFTMPYMNTGVGILYKKKAPPSPNLFSFLSPLSIDVWIYMTTAYLATSITMFILARITPVEWANANPLIRKPEVLETQFCLMNALWFGIGSLLGQGCDLLPKAISTRMVAGMWWFFTLIMISSYTANLAAFLTAAKMEVPINSPEDLAKQTKIKYGTYCCGSTDAFFKSSTIPTYQKLNAAMESAKPSVYTERNSDGLERVKKEDGMYAFFMEAASIEYHVERQCDLTQIGGLLDTKGYGVALPPGSPYTSTISAAILKLQEKGILQELKLKWWRNSEGESCDDGGSDGGAQLSLANLGGVFIVLVGGTIVSCFIAVMEFAWKKRRLIRNENESLIHELWKEFKFAIDIRAGDTKPISSKESAIGAIDSTRSHFGSRSALEEDGTGTRVYGEITDKMDTISKLGVKTECNCGCKSQ